MKNTLFVALLFIALVGACLAQTQFVRAVGGFYYEYASGLVQTSDSGYAMTGWTSTYGAGNRDIFLLKFSSTGEFQWAHAIGGTGRDVGNSLVQTKDGGFAVTGWITGLGAGGNDLFLMKFNSLGVLEWSRAVGGTSDEGGESVVQTSDSGYAVAGWTISYGAGGHDLFFVKFSSTGVFQWARTIGTSTWNEKAWSIIQAYDGGYVMVGEAAIFSGYGDALYVKFSLAGEFQWARAVGASGMTFDSGLSLVQTTDSGFASSGFTNAFGAGGYDLFLIKLNSAGEFQWARAVGGTGDDGGISTFYYPLAGLVQTSDDGFAMVGYTYSFGAGGNDLFLVKFTSTGAVEWSRAVGGTGYDDCSSVVQTSDGGFAVAGETNSFGASTSDLFLVKFDAAGNTCLGAAISPTVTTVTPSVASPSLSVASPSPTVTVVTPTVTEICTDFDVTEIIIKPQGFEIAVSPNPFNSSCDISAPFGAKIEIYDLQGKCVGAGLVPAQQQGDHEGRPYIWHPEKEMGSGIYLVKATTKNGLTATKRIMYLK